MEVLNTPCSCGGTSKFLRKKGAATGLYCGQCEKWFKWVGKKDIDRYKQRGFKVHAEKYSPNNIGQEQPQNNQSQFSQSDYPATSNNDDQEFLSQYALPATSIPPHPYDEANQHTNEEDTLPEFNSFEEFEEVEEDYPQTNSLNRPSGQRTKLKDDTICLTCISGVIEPMNKSTKITANIFDGVLNIKNGDKTKLFGSFNIKFCPSCGKAL